MREARCLVRTAQDAPVYIGFEDVFPEARRKRAGPGDWTDEKSMFLVLSSGC